MSKKGIVEEVVVGIDTTNEEVLQWDKEGKELVWGEFKELPEEVVKELSYKNQKKYFIAEGKELAGKEKKVRKKEPEITQDDILDPLGDYAKKRLEIRKRKGYHQCWKRPDELAEALNMGYHQVRELSNEQIKKGEKVESGYENGAVRRIGKEEDSELIAMEIKREIFDRHIQAVSLKSHRRFIENKDEFKGKAERVGVDYIDDDE